MSALDKLLNVKDNWYQPYSSMEKTSWEYVGKVDVEQAAAELAALRTELDEANRIIAKNQEHLTCAQFDYSNGNTDPSGMTDEGEVYGWQAHKILTDMNAAWLAKQDGDA